MWPPTGLTTRGWLDITPELLPIAALYALQDVKSEWVTAKQLGAPSWCGDPLIHVIDWSGRWWVEDGHHRLRAAICRSESHVVARVWSAGSERVTARREASADDISGGIVVETVVAGDVSGAHYGAAPIRFDARLVV